MLAHGHDQIRHQLSFPHITLDGLGLHIHSAYKLHLRNHPGGLFLPVEDIDQLVIGGIHGIVDDRVRLLAFAIQIVLCLALPLLANHRAARVVLVQFEQAVQRIGHIVLAGIIHEIENHQIIFVFRRAHAAAKLLRVQHL